MSADNVSSAQPSSEITITANSNDATPASNTQGIDIRQAMEILASRTSHDHDHDHSHSSDEHQAGCQQSATDDAKNLGQTIDLATGETTADPATIAMSMEEQKKQLDQDRKIREEQIRAHLQTMSVKDLLQAVMEAQKERVATYRTYDGCVLVCCFVFG